MPKAVKARDRDYARLKKYSEEHEVSIQDALSSAVKRLEVKKMVDKEKDIVMCDECEEEIPKDASFCPYCGVEFGEDEDIEESEEED